MNIVVYIIPRYVWPEVQPVQCRVQCVAGPGAVLYCTVVQRCAVESSHTDWGCLAPSEHQAATREGRLSLSQSVSQANTVIHSDYSITVITSQT